MTARYYEQIVAAEAAAAAAAAAATADQQQPAAAPATASDAAANSAPGAPSPPPSGCYATRCYALCALRMRGVPNFFFAGRRGCAPYFVIYTEVDRAEEGLARSVFERN